MVSEYIDDRLHYRGDFLGKVMVGFQKGQGALEFSLDNLYLIFVAHRGVLYM